jgi:hypothetical protein
MVTNPKRKTTKRKTTRKKATPASRESRTREATNAVAAWAPPNRLDAPPAPRGYKHRWVRIETLGEDDKANFNSRLREGFVPVRKEEYPEFNAPTIQDGEHAGIFATGGLVLCKIPEKIVKQRDEYYRGRTSRQMESVDAQLYESNDPMMPLINPDRKSDVVFGGR